jgi:WXG100 family type VII secretion target
MSGYDVDPTELFAAEAMVREAAEQGRAELTRLRHAAQDLLDEHWRGTAATAFAAGWQEWVGGAQTVLTALDAMARALGTTAVQYEQNETGISLDLRKIA